MFSSIPGIPYTKYLELLKSEVWKNLLDAKTETESFTYFLTFTPETHE